MTIVYPYSTKRIPLMRPVLLLALLTLLVGFASAQPPACYHSLDEIHEHIFGLQEMYPEMVRVDSIGHSVSDNLPIYLVKISNNVNVDADKPATLFIGHIHGEEILGIELVLTAMDTLLSNPRPEYRNRRNNLENYFIVTMNPEGLNVVFGIGDNLAHGADVSYRKNKRDNVGDGIFRYQLGLGNDSSGVDLNRNWNLHFYQGDTLFHYTTQVERYDYYRGSHPFSEPEAQAVRWAYNTLNPMFGATYHSSRQGGLSEKVFYPWDWGNDGVKLNPDQDVLDNIAQETAARIHSMSGPGYYQALRSSGRAGKMHDWAYAEGGWINLEVELANAVIQPDCATRNQIVQDGLTHMYYLMDRAFGRTDLPTSSGHLKVIVQDQDGEPLVAEVRITNRHNRYMDPRMTDPVHGVTRRPLLAGSYPVLTRKWGYTSDSRTMTVGNIGGAAYTVTLQELPRHSVLVRSYDSAAAELVPATLVLRHEHGTEVFEAQNGEYPASWPEGEYSLEVWSAGLIPERFDFELSGTQLIEAYLVSPEMSIEDDFESTLPERWSSGGDFGFAPTGLDSHTGSMSLKSHDNPQGSSWNVPVNSDGWIEVSYSIPAGSESLVLTGWRKYELEPEYDFGFTDYRVDDGDWIALDTLNGYREWDRFMYDFRDHRAASSIAVRWRVVTDATDQDRGLFIDDLAFMSSSDYVSAEEPEGTPNRWSFDTPYPNPFNPTTTLRFEVAQAGQVSILVFDLLGRQVAEVLNDRIAPGSHMRTLDMGGYASGLYLVRMQSEDFAATRKILLVK